MTGDAEGFSATADTLFKNAGVSISDEERHTALGDAKATAEAMHTILNNMKEKNNV